MKREWSRPACGNRLCEVGMHTVMCRWEIEHGPERTPCKAAFGRWMQRPSTWLLLVLFGFALGWSWGWAWGSL